MRLFVLFSILAVLLVGVGCAIVQIFPSKKFDWREFAASDNTKVTAFALLSHYENGKDEKWMKTQPQLHGEAVLSQKLVQDLETRRELRQTLAGFKLIQSGPDCTPVYRHALRFEKEGHVVDVMICFSCGQMEIFDSLGETTKAYFESEPPQSRDQFDAIFARLGLKQFKPYAKK